MNCLCAIYVDRNQRAFLAHTRSFVVRCDVIYHLSPINSQYLMTWEVDSPGNVFLGLTCNSQSLPPSVDKKYHRNFLCYFEQSRVILSFGFVFAVNYDVIWKP